MPEQPIDEVSVALVVDAVKFLEDYDAALDEALERAEKFEKRFTDALAQEGAPAGESAVDSLKKLGETGVEEVEKIDKAFEGLGETIDEVGTENIEAVSDETQRSFDELFRTIDKVGIERVPEAIEGIGEGFEGLGEQIGDVGAEQVETAVDEMVDDMDRLGEAVSEGVTEQVARGLRDIGDLSDEARGIIDAVISDLESALGREVEPEVVQALTDVMASLEQVGGQVTDEIARPLGVIFESWREGADDVEYFNQQIAELSPQLAQLFGDFVMVNDIVEDVTQTWEETGRVVPLDQIDRFRQKLFQVTETYREVGASQQELSERLMELREQFMAQNQLLDETNQLDVLIEEQIQTLARAWAMLGEELPLDEHARLVRAFERIKNDGEEVAATEERIAEAIRQKTAAELQELGAMARKQAINEKIIQVVQRVSQELEKEGEAMPIEEAQAFARSLGRIADASQEAGESVQETSTRLDEAGDRFVESGGEQSNVAAQFRNEMTQLGSMLLRQVGIVAAITTAYQALNRAIREGIDIAVRRSEAQWQLNIAIQRAQEVMGEQIGTIAEWNELADELVINLQLQREEAQRAVSGALQLTAQFDLQREMVEDLVREGAGLAKMYGRDIPSSIESLIRFVATGRREGLERFNLRVDEGAQQWAAWNMGIRDSIDNLDEATLTQVRFNTVLEQSQNAFEDAQSASETFAGRMAELQIEADDVKQVLGEIARPAALLFEELKVTALQALTIIIAELRKMSQEFFKTIAEARASVLVTLDLFDRLRAVRERTTAGEGVTQALREEFEGFAGETGNLLDRWNAEVAEQMDQLQSTLTDPAIEDAFGESSDTAMEWSTEMATAFSRVVSALRDAGREYQRGLERIDERLEEDRRRIIQRFDEREIDAYEDYQEDLTRLQQQAEERRYQARRDHQRDMERLREDHLLRLKELEEGFLFDLEDAIRARDAKRVFLLTRRYELEKRQEERDYEVRQRRLREDLQFELEEIQRQLEMKRELRYQAYLQEIADIREQEAQALAEREARAEREREQLRETMDERLEILGEKLQEELQLTNEQLSRIEKRYLETYGPNGFLLSILRGFAQQSSAIIAASIAAGIAGGINAAAGAVPTPKRGSRTVVTTEQLPGEWELIGSEKRNFQRGGSFLATSPTDITVGEAGIERVDITPLHPVTGGPRTDFQQGAMARALIELNVALDDGLVGEIVDKSMNEAADVVMNITRKSGGRVGR